jgi:hypothetical protein
VVICLSQGCATVLGAGHRFATSVSTDPCGGSWGASESSGAMGLGDAPEAGACSVEVGRARSCRKSRAEGWWKWRQDCPS